jgi:3-phosphoshikimate 1-carboxyvinyltransferase
MLSRKKPMLEFRPGRALRGECLLPGDKSISHRAALFAALAKGESRIENFLDAGVTQAMLAALSALNVEWSLEDSALIVNGKGRTGLRTPSAPIYCGHSATTMRLLAGALAGANISCVLDGSESLCARPMRRIVDPLSELGVQIECTPEGTAPLILHALPLSERPQSIEINLPTASAQVKSAVLLAALNAQGRIILREPGPSRDHTERMLKGMGAPVSFGDREGEILIEAHDGSLKPLRTAIPGDISSAAFLIVAAIIIPGSDLVLRNLGLNPTRTGILDALLAMGAKIEISPYPQDIDRLGEPRGDVHVRHSELHAVDIQGPLVVRMIDEFPAFSIAAAFAHGETRVRDAVELRHKESDRIKALSAELKRIGVRIEEQDDGFKIQGGKTIPGGEMAQSYHDHRLAMAMGIAGLAAEKPITIRNAEIIAQSFPGFTHQIGQLGGEIVTCE